MTTLVIHGIAVSRSPADDGWWWNSWGRGGLLHSVREGMLQAGGYEDVWKAGGTLVREIERLQRRRRWRGGGSNDWNTHQGHFTWSGSYDPAALVAGASELARYLNALEEIAPYDPISLIAHGQGCNLVKLASGDAGLSSSLFIHRAVFLACPHVQPVRLSPRRFGAVLNLFSLSDTVQSSAPTARRVDQDRAATCYENQELPTTDQGQSAHHALHGSTAGFLSGAWLAGDITTAQLMEKYNYMLPTPARDHGDGF